MLKLRVDWGVVRDLSWIHWAVTIPLVAAHLTGIPGAMMAAIALCAIAALGYFAVTQSIRAMPVQVRMGYLILLLVGELPFCDWIHWVQLIGTTAMVSIGYCPLLRMLRLLPWNRKSPFTLSLLGRVFFLDRAEGGFVQCNPTSKIDSMGTLESCSLRSGQITRPTTKSILSSEGC